MTLLSEIVGRASSQIPFTLKTLLLDAAQKHSNAVAVASLHQSATLLPTISTGDGSSHHLRWTYHELLQGAGLLAAALQQQGLQRGDAVAIFLPNSGEWALLFWTAVLSGLRLVIVQPRVAANPDELRHTLELSKPSALIASDLELCEQLRQSANEDVEKIPVKVVSDNETPLGWFSLNSLLECDTSTTNTGLEDQDADLDDTAVVLFTSGTTGLSKGAAHTHRSLAAMFANHVENLGLDERSTSASHLTITHCFGMVYSGSFWLAGGKVVYPAASFNADATLRAVELEGCTHMPAVPSLLHGLVDSLQLESSKLETLRHVEFSGAMITPEVFESAREKLGASIVSAHYGLTECGPTIVWKHDCVPLSFPDGQVSAGFPVSDATIRICAPETTSPLARGEAGEIHLGGPQIVRSYLGGASPQTFYHDRFGHWMRTGDQGKMLSGGELLVSGRYKDIIIRGGENISPAQIEAVVNVRKGVFVQIVGAPDAIMGEVPVAVVQGAVAEDDFDFVKLLPAAVLKSLGPKFALDEVVTINDLGLEQMPMTVSGKIKKHELAAAVQKYRVKADSMFDSSSDGGSSRERSHSPESEISVLNLVRDVWARILGVDVASLTAGTSIANLADSLTMMQARQLFRKRLGADLSMPQLLGSPTIAEQAALLSHIRDKKVPEASRVESRQGPPMVQDIVEACGDELRAQAIRAQASPFLAMYGLDWERDAEDVIPMNDVLSSMLVSRRRLKSSLRRDAFWVPGTSVENMASVLQRALDLHPVMRSMWFPSSATSISQLVVRPTELSMPVFIDRERHTVEKAEDLSTVWLGDQQRDTCGAQKGPGPMFRAAVFEITDQPGSAGFVYWTHHSCFDATSLSYFIETIEDLLDGKLETPRTSYKLWADTYFSGRNGHFAQAGAKYLADKFEGFASCKRSIVPRPRAPCFFEGDDSGWIDPNTNRPGDPTLRTPLESNGMAIGNAGLTHLLSLPGLTQLRESHGIAAHIVLKAALALANTTWTSTNTAYFRSLQSGRQWPFLPTAVSAHLPSAVDVAGPTLQTTANLIHLTDPAETLGSFLRRLATDQALTTQYECTPLSSALALTTPADRAALLDVGLCQLFNWLPSRRHLDFKKLQQVQNEMNADTGLHWDFSSRDTQNVELFVRWDGCHLRRAEVEGMVADVEAAAAWVSEVGNWESLLGGRPRGTGYRVWSGPEFLVWPNS
ncbi:hypothetical protein MBLNU230_g1828t1 [Neophaeotheca triangularis]